MSHLLRDIQEASIPTPSSCEHPYQFLVVLKFLVDAAQEESCCGDWLALCYLLSTSPILLCSLATSVMSEVPLRTSASLILSCFVFFAT